ncbi:cytochrome P450 [Mycena capillaripes]|nr:cytochrome P450 [Mycena capillaripes]
MSPSAPTATAVVASLACYLFFKRYEPKDVALLAGLLVIPPLVIAFLPQEYPRELLGSLLSAYTLYYAGLLVSVITYRISPVHPLSKYPGPVVCKISKLWLTFVVSRGKKLHVYLKGLHDKYGSVIRIGPNELSITDVSLVPFILGTNGKPKGPLWDGRKITGKKGVESKEAARGNLIGSRDLKVHSEARKAWNRAFMPGAIKGYEPMLVRRVVQLIEALGAQKGASLDISQWLSFFSFDFMGDIAFGGGFELMRDGDKNSLWHKMERGLYFPALTQQIPWCLGFLPFFPWVGQEMKAFGNLLLSKLRDGLKRDRFTMTSIVAGSDTSATVLRNIFFLLLSHPESYKRLQLELDQAFPAGKEPTDAATLSILPYLNAVIKEALRMMPPVATSLQRAPMAESVSKVLREGFVIPEGTAVVVSPYAMHHDPRYFYPSPENFVPDRWLAREDDPRFITNEDAFIPFSTGPANCVGKNLANLEIRMVVAYVMQAYEMRFADGYDKHRWEADLKDYFVLQKGSLPIILTARNI